ncbi:MAG: 50S ribosomal protein L6 [Gammaproteobacteria bacterium]|nr:50S ribosomal protein L6 [Gammaproteobacteria bacterium]
MSLRTAKKPIAIPAKVEVKFDAGVLTVKGQKDSLRIDIDESIEIKISDNVINLIADLNCNKDKKALIGATCANIKNMLQGVSAGFEKKLVLVGVGYRVALKGKALSLSLGFSHPVEYTPPSDIQIEVPSQTEIVIKGNNKQVVGQVAAEIRAYRSPEPYKGKGVKYANETIVIKETKKK